MKADRYRKWSRQESRDRFVAAMILLGFGPSYQALAAVWDAFDRARRAGEWVPK